MVNIGDIGSKAGAVGSTVLNWVLIVVGGIILLVIVGGIIWWAVKRKKWNLRVEIKMPRSDGQLIISERAKGHYDVNAGIVDIKRKNLKAVGMKPFDVRKYLQGNNYLEVIQVSPKDFIPVLPKSYTTLKDEDGKECAVLDIETNLEKRRTWKTYMERAAKNRFTLIGFLDKHWRAIEISIILFVIFLGMSILWMRMPTICG